MDKLPKRIKLAKIARAPFEFLEGLYPRLNINPGVFTVVGILASIIFVFFAKLFPANIIILFVVLYSDTLDGAFARQRKEKKTKEGYIIDVTFDRLSEVILALPLIDGLDGKIFLTLVILNFILTYRSIVTGKHVIIALRVMLFIYLILKGLGWISLP